MIVKLNIINIKKRYNKVNLKVSTSLRCGFGGQECPKPHLFTVNLNIGIEH